MLSRWITQGGSLSGITRRASLSPYAQAWGVAQPVRDEETRALCLPELLALWRPQNRQELEARNAREDMRAWRQDLREELVPVLDVMRKLSKQGRLWSPGWEKQEAKAADEEDPFEVAVFPRSRTVT